MKDPEPNPQSQLPAERHAPIPGWLLGFGVILSFWAGGYLFAFSGGFRGDIYDPSQVTWGPVNSGPVAPPDPKVIGKRLFTANCAQCHQATGLGQAGVYPPLAQSEWVVGSKSRLISILHKGIAGAIHVKGAVYNNNMPAWGTGAPIELKDAQIAAVLTYIRSDWGNSASPIAEEEVAAKRKELSSITSPWSETGLLAIPDESATPPAPASPAKK
jgi:mono/diheme cytochrome c family protein